MDKRTWKKIKRGMQEDCVVKKTKMVTVFVSAGLTYEIPLEEWKKRQERMKIKN